MENISFSERLVEAERSLAAKRNEAAQMDGETFLVRNGQTNRHRTDA